MTNQEAEAILAEPITMYGLVAGKKRGVVDLVFSTAVKMGEGVVGSRWSQKYVKSGKQKELEPEMSALNVEIAARRTEARKVLGVTL